MQSKKYIIEYDELMEEWFWEKNNELDIDPTKITKGYEEKKPYWKCKKCGYLWSTTVGHRIRGRGCPECAKKKRANTIIRTIVKRRGSFCDEHPELLTEWDYNRNQIDPFMITKGSNIKVYWKCKKCGNFWSSSVSNRLRGRGCPECAKIKGRKQRRFNEIIKNGSFLENCPDLIDEWNWDKNNSNGIKPDEIPVNFREKVYWKCKKCGKSYKTYTFTRKYGTSCPYCNKSKPFSIPEKLLLFYIEQCFEKVIENYKPKFLGGRKEIDIYIPELKIGIEYDGEKFHKDINVDIAKIDLCKENGIRLYRIREPLCPMIKNENVYCMEKRWDFKNIMLFLSNKIGFNFEKVNIDINNDILKVASKIQTYLVEESLAAKYPDLLNEWDYQLNRDLIPENIKYASNIMVNWICENGHKYVMKISKRTLREQGCPYCSGRYAIKDVNDLATLRPDLVEYWDFKKNGDLKPDMVKTNTEKKVSWLCKKCGLEWDLSVASMSKRKYICKKCKNTN